jgi:hypothetical protein
MANPQSMQITQPDPTTFTTTVRLPDDVAMVRALAEAMARASEKAKAQHLDFVAQTAAVQEFARSVRRSPADIEDSLVLQYGERVRVIRSAELLARTEAASPLEEETSRFEGEAVVARALDDLLAERGLLYFAEGNGERRIADAGPEGLRQAAEQLKARGFQVAALDLTSAKAIPANCQALLLPGPRKAYGAELEAAIARYADAGGRLALMLDPPNSSVVLADLLKRCGVTVPEPARVLRSSAAGFADPRIIQVELNRKLDFVRRWTQEPCVFVTACELVVTSPPEDAAYQVFRVARPAESEADAKPPCLIAAVAPTAKGKGPKMLVMGDVDAFSNQIIRQVPTCADLLLDALTWLAE